MRRRPLGRSGMVLLALSAVLVLGALVALFAQMLGRDHAGPSVRLAAEGHAPVDEHAPQQIQIGEGMEYFGLHWTLLQAVAYSSLAMQQAPAGMRFMVLTLRVDNPLAQKVIVGSPFDYVRLSAQDAVLSPIQSTLPVAFNAGEQDTLGTVTFIVPGNKTTLSCILLAQTDEGFTQASAGFQIP